MRKYLIKNNKQYIIMDKFKIMIGLNGLYIERIKNGNTIIPETFSYINEMKITSSK